MPQGAQRSIRLHLVMLVLGVALPLFALVAWGFWNQLDHERRDSRDLAHRIARSIAGDLRDSNMRAEAIITRMAARPRVRAGNAADCDTLFPVVDFFPQYLPLQLFMAGGELLCGSEPQPGEAAIAREAQNTILAYLTSHTDIPHDPLILPVRGRWISIMFRPVQSTSQSKLVLTLVQYLDFNIDAYPRGTVVTIVNEENFILARSQDPEKWIGKRGTHPRLPDDRREGSAEA